MGTDQTTLAAAGSEPVSVEAIGEDGSTRVVQLDALRPARIARLDLAQRPFAADTLRRAGEALAATAGAPVPAGGFEVVARAVRHGDPIEDDPWSSAAAQRFDAALATHRAAPIDVAVLQRLHQAVLGLDSPAELRASQTYIGPVDAPVFVPPHARDVERLLVDLCAWIARDDVDTVTQVAIAWAQLTLIHPFEDGNGRLARAVTALLLDRRVSRAAATTPIAVALFRENEAYEYGLRELYQRGHGSEWCALFAGATEQAVDLSRRLGNASPRRRRRWLRQVAGANARLRFR